MQDFYSASISDHFQSYISLNMDFANCIRFPCTCVKFFTGAFVVELKERGLFLVHTACTVVTLIVVTLKHHHLLLSILA